MGIENVLEERGKNYGAFSGHAKITQDLKRSMQSHAKWDTLSDSQKESLEMIQHKIGRILNGDPSYVDSWTDISGYAKLVEDQLLGKAETGASPKDENTFQIRVPRLYNAMSIPNVEFLKGDKGRIWIRLLKGNAELGLEDIKQIACVLVDNSGCSEPVIVRGNPCADLVDLDDVRELRDESIRVSVKDRKLCLDTGRYRGYVVLDKAGINELMRRILYVFQTYSDLRGSLYDY